MANEEFERELSHLLNKHGIDNLSGTPDFILAKMLISQIRVYADTLGATRNWHGWSTLWDGQ